MVDPADDDDEFGFGAWDRQVAAERALAAASRSPPAVGAAAALPAVPAKPRAAWPEPLPARMLNEWTYCPRLAVLEHLHGEWDGNAFTEDGKRIHRRVDEERGEWPVAEAIQGREVARSLWLTAEHDGITARIDLVEADDEPGWVRPIDYKRGEVPDIPGNAWPADRVQACAQALVLRAHGYRVRTAGLWYAASSKRVYIAIDDALVSQTLRCVGELRAALARAELPPPLVASSKCEGCSLAPICLPDELACLADPTAAGREPEERIERRLIPARDDAMPVHVCTPGCKIGISGDELVVSGRENARIPLTQVLHVAAHGGVSVTGPALTRLMADGIPVAFLSQGGWFYGMAAGLPHGNVWLRRAQFAAAAEPARALALAKRLVYIKIRNQRHLLRRNSSREGDQLAAAVVAALRQMKEASQAALEAPDLAALLGCEGVAARAYFGQFAAMFSAQAAWAGFEMDGRNRRPPTDPANASLSFAYALLTREWAHVLWRVGLDPLLGFLHQPRHARPALALDLMEEFRPIVADSAVLTALNTGELQAGHFVQRGPAVNLNEYGRKKLIACFERRMDALVTHPVFGYRISYRRVFEVQARLLARHLLGEIDSFPTFEVR